MGLVQAELERRGIVTSAITLLPEITGRLRVPRALAVPYDLGYPLGAPGQPELQRSILRAALALTARDEVPFIETFRG